MLVYHIRWTVDKDLVKGKGRTSHAEYLINLSVLCNNIKEAQACFLWYFRHEFPWHRLSLSPDDGELILKRAKIDSRGFFPNYLYMDNMKIPINLHDPSGSLVAYSNLLR